MLLAATFLRLRLNLESFRTSSNYSTYQVCSTEVVGSLNIVDLCCRIPSCFIMVLVPQKSSVAYCKFISPLKVKT